MIITVEHALMPVEPNTWRRCFWTNFCHNIKCRVKLTTFKCPVTESTSSLIFSINKCDFVLLNILTRLKTWMFDLVFNTFFPLVSRRYLTEACSKKTTSNSLKPLFKRHIWDMQSECESSCCRLLSVYNCEWNNRKLSYLIHTSSIYNSRNWVARKKRNYWQMKKRKLNVRN